MGLRKAPSGKPRGKLNQRQASGGHKRNLTKPQKQQRPAFLRALVLYGAAPDERYVSGKLGFLRVWKSVENLAYSN